MRWLVLIALIAVLAILACGGGSKPPLVPDDPNAPHPELEVDAGSAEAGW